MATLNLNTALHVNYLMDIGVNTTPTCPFVFLWVRVSISFFKRSKAAWLGVLVRLLVSSYINMNSLRIHFAGYSLRMSKGWKPKFLLLSDPQLSCSMRSSVSWVTATVCFPLRYPNSGVLSLPTLRACFYFSFSVFLLLVFPLYLLFFPSLLPLFLPLQTGLVFVVWSEICMQRSSAPLRTCSWMMRTLASCCSPGVASASHETSSSESADRPGISSSPDQSSLFDFGRNGSY